MRTHIGIIVLALTIVTSLGAVPHAVAQRKPHVVATVAPGKSSATATEKSAAVAPEHAFSITQRHYFLGRWQILLNGDKVKATNLTEGYSIVTMAPTWKVVFFRDNGGAKMYETTMKNFMSTGIPLSSGYVIEGDIGEARQHKARYKGLITLEYNFQRLDRTVSKPVWTLADVPKEAAVCLSQYWVSTMITRDYTVGNFLQKLFMVPATVGYPVAFVDTRTDNTRNTVLDILSCRGLPPADVQIVYPSAPKYKVCKGIRDVTLSTAKRESFNEWAETLGKD